MLKRDRRADSDPLPEHRPHRDPNARLRYDRRRAPGIVLHSESDDDSHGEGEDATGGRSHGPGPVANFIRLLPKRLPENT